MAMDEPQEASAPHDGQAHAVLVIEDDLFFSVRIEKTLAKMGYGVEVIANGDEAVAWAEERGPMLAIINFASDHIAPGEVTERLKALARPPKVLGYVSHGWIPEVRPVAMEAGCDLLVANSAIATRLPRLVSRLAPLDGSASRVAEAAEIAASAEE